MHRLFIVAFIFVGSAMAWASPDSLFYQGIFTDSNKRVTLRNASVTVRIFEAPDSYAGEAPIWGPKILPNIDVHNGLFTLSLSGNDEQMSDQSPKGRELTDVIKQSHSAFVEVLINNVVVEPRGQLLSVPFAFSAKHSQESDKASHADNSALVNGKDVVAMFNRLKGRVDQLENKLEKARKFLKTPQYKDCEAPIMRLSSYEKESDTKKENKHLKWDDIRRLHGRQITYPSGKREKWSKIGGAFFCPQGKTMVGISVSSHSHLMGARSQISKSKSEQRPICCVPKF